jgi:hypothetical protein
MEVGLFPGMGCMVPQPCAAEGNRSYAGVLGCIWRPAVPRVNYPDSSPKALCEWVVGVGPSMVV